MNFVLVDYMCMKNDEGVRSYYAPELRFINEFNVQDLIGKYDFQKIVVYSLGLTFLKLLTRFEDSRIEKMYEEGFRQEIGQIKDPDLQRIVGLMLRQDIRQRPDYITLIDQVVEVLKNKTEMDTLLKINSQLRWLAELLDSYGVKYRLSFHYNKELIYKFHGNFSHSTSTKLNIFLEDEETLKDRLSFRDLDSLIGEIENNLILRGYLNISDNPYNYGYIREENYDTVNKCLMTLRYVHAYKQV